MIFVNGIDSVSGLKFPINSFFAFIRASKEARREKLVGTQPSLLAIEANQSLTHAFPLLIGVVVTVAVIAVPSSAHAESALLTAKTEIALLQKGTTLKSINEYLSISPLLSSRVAVNSAMQQALFQGDAPSFSPDGKHVLTQDGTTIRLYDLIGKKLVDLQGIHPKFSPDGKQVATVVGTMSHLSLGVRPQLQLACMT